MRKCLLPVCFFSFLLLVLFCTDGFSAKTGKTLHKTPKKHGVVHRSKSAKAKRHTARHHFKIGKIRIRTAKGGKALARKTEEQPAREEAAAAEDADSDYIAYTAKRGDTVDSLAKAYNIDREEIIDLNRFNRKRLKPGMTVYIPKEEKDAEDAPIVLPGRPLKPWKSDEERGILVKVAESFTGAPYKYGGDSVRGLDCSAFVRKMYEIFEVHLPRSAREQFCAGPRVAKSDLATGDLVFFKTRRLANYPTHVGIYIGDEKFIHASSLLHRGVKIDRLDEAYFTRTYMGAVRVMAPPQKPADKKEVDQDAPDSSHSS